MIKQLLKGSYRSEQLLLLVITFSNFWIYKIFSADFLLALDLILLTQSIYLINYFSIKKKWVFKYKILIIGLFLVTTLFLRINLYKFGFDKNIFIFSPDDKSKLNLRHSFYSESLGGVFTNKFSLNFYKNYSIPIYKISDNFFNSLDINYYFFEGHPREKAYLPNFPKFPFILVIFFMIGIIRIIYLRLWFVGLYVTLVAILQAFLIQNYFLGPILFFPFIILSIFYGAEYLLRRFIK